MTEDNDSRDLFPGALEMVILQTLRRAPMHGYALAQVIKRTSDDLLEIEESSLYPTLQRNAEGGLPGCRMGSVGAQPPRFVFTGSRRRAANSSNVRCRALSPY
jgi:DNA-binding PadR family transcriptional regulator